MLRRLTSIERRFPLQAEIGLGVLTERRGAHLHVKVRDAYFLPRNCL